MTSWWKLLTQSSVLSYMKGMSANADTKSASSSTEKQHTSTSVEAGAEEVITNISVWPATDIVRLGLASIRRTPGNLLLQNARRMPTK